MKLIKDLDVYAYRKGWPQWACIFVPLFYPSTWPIIVYRFGNWTVKIKNRFLKAALYLVYFPLKRITEILTTIEISEFAEIGVGLYIAHLGSIVIAHHSVIGEYSSFHQGVTIGVSGSGERLPVIGDRVYFGAGAKILGPVKIGNGVVIGANAVVIGKAPDNAVMFGIPARAMSLGGSDKFIHYRNKARSGARAPSIIHKDD